MQPESITSALTSKDDGAPATLNKSALLVVIVGIVMAVLDGSIVNLALPEIGRELNASAAQSIWVINAYQIATLALLLPMANWGDRIGYRRVYLSGMVTFTLASVGCALANSLETLAFARALQGVGAAGLMGVNAALIRLIYPRHLLGRGIAINSTVVAIAAVAGPSVSAAILSVASWPWLFALNIPMGLLAFFIGRKVLPNNRASMAENVISPPDKPATAGKQSSWVDVLLNGLMFGLIFLGVDGLGVRSTSALEGAGFPVWAMVELTAGIAIGVVYMRRQLRLTVPLFPLDLLRIPVFALSIGTSVAAFSAQMLAYVALPFLLLGALSRSHVETGLLLTAWPICIVLVSIVIARLIGRMDGGLLGGVGLGVMALGLASLALLPMDASNADIVWRMALCGAGFGLFQSPNNHIIILSAPLHRSGGASGMLGTARLTGQTTGALLMAIIFSVWGQKDVGSAAMDLAYQSQASFAALWLAAAFALLAGIFSLLRIGRGVGSGPV